MLTNFLRASAASCIFLFFLAASSTCFGQSEFYDLNKIQKIEINFSQSNWDYILDSSKAGSDGYTMARWVKVNGVLYDTVGVKYKGNSSYNASRIKNPLHIKLDKYKNYNYLGFEDIKLANIFSDPSMIREPLSYAILKNYMHCSRANFAQVWINGTFMGLYTNDEDVNKQFLNTHFYSKNNTFIQCNPQMTGGMGSKSNLKYISADSTQYYRFYDMESDYGWRDLVRLCDTVTNYPNLLATSMDIDRAIWMLAFDNLLVNLDSYLGSFAQNYYLYKDNTGRYSSIVWDLNMSFGAFSNTGSPGGGSSLASMQQLTPNLHAADADWPLAKAILLNPQWKRMYIAHMKTMANEMFAGGLYQTLAAQMQAVIDTAVQSDPNKFYTYAQFKTGMTGDVGGGMGGGGGGMGVIPGIANLMSGRLSYLNTTAEFSAAAPTIASITAGVTSNTAAITARVTNTNANAVYLGYRFDSTNGQFAKIFMYDDGTHGDGAAGDNVYGASITMAAPICQYYIYAENNNAGAFSPARAEHEFYYVQAGSASLPAGTPFTEGNVVVVRVGDGSGSLSGGTAAASFLDEYTPAGALVQSVALPAAANGNNRMLTLSGTATSEGYITRSPDGRWLSLAGYNAAPGTAGINNAASAVTNRTIALVNNASVVNTATSLTDAADGNNIRGAVTNGTDIWLTGAAGGVRYTTLGASTSTQLSATLTNLRGINIFNKQLYVSTSSGSAIRLGTVGTGMPVAASQTIAGLPGYNVTNSSPHQFFMADLNTAVAGPDVMYIADDNSTAGGILKYSLTGGNWVLNNTVGAAADEYRGITGVTSGTTVVLYAVRKGGSGVAGGGELVKLTDNSGYNAPNSGTPALIATASVNTAFRGVALTPTISSIVLPLKLLSFGAVYSNGRAETVWYTANETGLSRFEIERSADGVHFTRLADVQATNTTGSRYHFSDASPLAGASYYRLKMIDKDGRIGYSQVVVLKTIATGTVAVYPNPAGNDLIITHNPVSGDAQAIISDVSGKQLIRQTLQHGSVVSMINVTRLRSGIYMLSVQTGEGRSITKFMKQ